MTTRKAAADLAKAILVHQGHMAGKIPTTGPKGEKSQMQMMSLMKAALGELKAGKK